MTFCYQTGMEIHEGDRVLFHGEPAEVEFVATAVGLDPALDWYVEEHGGGVMIVELKTFGKAFIAEPDKAEDLVFVSRRQDR